MTKVVYNACYGGFSLSHEAIMRYAELKGIKVWPEPYKDFPSLGFEYWIVPPEGRPKLLAKDEWRTASHDERVASNEAHEKTTLASTRDLKRSDPVLAQVVEELGAKANGMCAELRIVDLPEGTQYRIDEYDGRETVATRDSYDWETA